MSDTINLTEEEKDLNVVAKALQTLMDNPHNQLNLALQITKTMYNALAALQNRNQVEMMRPVVVQTQYPGSFKAEVVAATTMDEGDSSDILDVVIHTPTTEETKNTAWELLDKGHPLHAALRKLVLSQPTAVDVGDVFYITTKGSLDAHLDQVASELSKDIISRAKADAQ